MEDVSFSAVLERYSHYLKAGGDRNHLLSLGKRLFGSSVATNAVRPSFDLLRAKESELEIATKPVVVTETRKTHAPRHGRSEAPPPIDSQQLPEEILVLQDRNGLMLARRKALERQRDEMNDQYGQLMERSVYQKVRLRMQMERLKAELAEALARSRPSFMQKQKPEAPSRPIMEELAVLNERVLTRINAFKMAVSSDRTAIERAVVDRYKAQMERILGQIYAHGEFVPSRDMVDRFSSVSDEIDHECRDIETELTNEHARNDQLQREAKQLGDEVAKQEGDVNRLKKQNSTRTRSIELLREIAADELYTARKEYAKLLDLNSDDGAQPSSARAMVVSSGDGARKLVRTHSGVFPVKKDSAVPVTKSIQEYVAEQQNLLQEKIIQYQHQH